MARVGNGARHVPGDRVVVLITIAVRGTVTTDARRGETNSTDLRKVIESVITEVFFVTYAINPAELLFVGNGHRLTHPAQPTLIMKL